MRHLASLLIAAVLAAGLLISAPALAEGRRVALVIGNSNYLHVPRLPNPANDADDLAQAFRRLGFEVRQASDLDDRGMRLALRDFGIMAERADVAVIYYAGHGVQIDGINYMIPVNARLSRDADVAFEALPLETLLRAVEPARGLKLVFIDACRDNPFLTDMRRTVATRSLGRGLSKIEPDGVVVGFAARDGTSALDGQGRNSPYAAAILQHVEEPGLELGKFFRKVRDSVLRSTGGLQEPFFYGSLPAEDIFLLPAGQRVGPDLSSIMADFAAAEAEGGVAAWQRFLGQYGEAADNPLVQIANRRLGSIGAEDPVPDPEPRIVAQPEETRQATPDWISSPLGPDGDYELTLEDRRAVQRALNMAGHATGGIDGQFGPRTRAAIAAVRRESALPPGGVDPALIGALPDPVATASLQSNRALPFEPDQLPDGLDYRLVRAIKTLGDRLMTFDYHEGHLYLAVVDRRSWASASSRARLMGGYLVTLGSLEEDRFVYRLFYQDSRFSTVDGTGAMRGPHIGLLHSSAGRGWGWMTQEALTYQNWAKGHPMRSGTGYGAYYRPASRRNAVSGPRYWEDTDGGSRNGYIVEVEY